MQVISAFGPAHCGRYDESSATPLVDIAAAVRDEYGGDLRKLAAHDVKGTVRLIKQLKGLLTLVRTFSCARCRTCGRGRGRASTSVP